MSDVDVDVDDVDMVEGRGTVLIDVVEVVR